MDNCNLYSEYMELGLELDAIGMELEKDLEKRQRISYWLDWLSIEIILLDLYVQTNNNFFNDPRHGSYSCDVIVSRSRSSARYFAVQFPVALPSSPPHLSPIDMILNDSQILHLQPYIHASTSSPPY